jgi:hypothetical protein
MSLELRAEASAGTIGSQATPKITGEGTGR